MMLMSESGRGAMELRVRLLDIPGISAIGGCRGGVGRLRRDGRRQNGRALVGRETGKDDGSARHDTKDGGKKQIVRLTIGLVPDP
jgi:hypothetical protein